MFVREMDGNGRIVIPKEMRKTLALNEGDGIAIYAEGENIILGKHSCVCFVCNGTKDVQKRNKAFLCEECRESLGELSMLRPPG
ncbi:MAG: AbrB/MazE/SpoVT family DNA-binding domain-containing protein [Defluviitaleaceae bacterium]|nr:AbrB/MazE/SpoVT family DNA-binding domain-containing protein [Defluviitaleaceae bacterium]